MHTVTNSTHLAIGFSLDAALAVARATAEREDAPTMPVAAMAAPATPFVLRMTERAAQALCALLSVVGRGGEEAELDDVYRVLTDAGCEVAHVNAYAEHGFVFVEREDGAR